ncbi:MAG: DNA-directed RNA polymerase subunit L [Candidatus Micrarchaeota archaeon]|nr:DNA-directed RNA polymerase subunit L [Candidatus Micrarchaeota archaeon]
MVEIKVDKKDKNHAEIHFIGEDIAFVHALRTYVMESDDVEFAAVKQEHLEVGEPILVIKTKKGDPVSIVSKAASKLAKEANDLLKSI